MSEAFVYGLQIGAVLAGGVVGVVAVLAVVCGVAWLLLMTGVVLTELTKKAVGK